ncbi:hypothetical protein [Mycoavidus sp. B2-EB]|uniref:hypothetical protein n=1 Tax=Mycoavidus sp. B2-EB TaxID=2651972 RepID=UPI001628D99E|nr:hypothetical protein [Mycoavidus sp. B2-EB]BBO60383.1 hypothetical protein MPB2EB_1524 [Mycoavidus sp. B2-EB]
MSKLITVLAAGFLMSSTAFAAGEYSATAPAADAATPTASTAVVAPATPTTSKKVTHAGKHAGKKVKSEASTSGTKTE